MLGWMDMLITCQIKIYLLHLLFVIVYCYKNKTVGGHLKFIQICANLKYTQTFIVTLSSLICTKYTRSMLKLFINNEVGGGVYTAEPKYRFE